MWAVRTLLAHFRRPSEKSDMNNDRAADRTLDIREMVELPTRTPDGDPADKHLLEREEQPRCARPYKPGIDVNLYATKKSVAQGMMDIALLTANASQLKYILKEGADSRFYLVNVICIGVSIALQLIVGVLLILNTRYNINLVSHQSKAELINNLTIIGIFLITVSNVFVSAFGSTPR
uniref:Ninjurin-1 n=1 Tax=Parasteatoda tepidariorum TaxID=114398 RepID=A0A2L2YC39_PARTP